MLSINLYWLVEPINNNQWIIYVVVQFLPLVQNFVNQYNFFWTSTNFFEPGQIFQLKSIWLFFVFVSNKKNIFGTFDLLFISTLLTLTYYPLPALPTSQLVFILPQCLPCVPWTQTFGFPLDSCPDALPVSHGDLNASSPIFLITYTQY